MNQLLGGSSGTGFDGFEHNAANLRRSRLADQSDRFFVMRSILGQGSIYAGPRLEIGFHAIGKDATDDKSAKALRAELSR